jgi:hypothetical protein
MDDVQTIKRATLARDAALRRLRRLTGVLIGGAVALSGLFAGVAASSTHTPKAVPPPRPETRSVTRTPPLPPEPSAPASATPTPPPQAPAATQQPPVVSSGGS